MSQETTLVCDWCGDRTSDRERSASWHLMWSLRSHIVFTTRYEPLEDLCPACWSALEAAVAALRGERKKKK